MPKAKKTLYLVIDHYGEWEDAWSTPYLAFEDKLAADECAERHQARNRNGFSSESDDEWWSDYDYSSVKEVQAILDEPTCRIGGHDGHEAGIGGKSDE